MQSLDTVRRVYELVLRHTSQLALLQCTSAYPTPDEHVQLRVLQQYRQLFPRAVVGYSGHEQGTIITVAAVALGAKVSVVCDLQSRYRFARCHCRVLKLDISSRDISHFQHICLA